MGQLQAAKSPKEEFEIYEFSLTIVIGKTTTITSIAVSLFHIVSGSEFYHVTGRHSITLSLT